MAAHQGSAYFEDYQIGQRFQSLGRTVTEADVVNYAGITGNWHPQHVDREYAKKSHFGQRIVQGALIYSIAHGLILAVPGVFAEIVANYGLEKLRFIKPVFIDDTLHVEAVVDAMGEHRLGGLMTYTFNVMNQHSELVCKFTQKAVVRKKADVVAS